MFQLVECRGPGHVVILSYHLTLEDALDVRAEILCNDHCIRIWDCERGMYLAADAYAECANL